MSTTIHTPEPAAHTPLRAPAADAGADPILTPAAAHTNAEPAMEPAAPVAEAAEVIDPQDWAASLEAVISDLDPVVTELPPTLPSTSCTKRIDGERFAMHFLHQTNRS